ncbi:MAG TPA: sensor histidine kinase [Streptosporangiaceae bacterium]|nr:sensor histidine kinase [Streptosporangiaceae bacterium]
MRVRSPQTRRLPPWVVAEGPFGVRLLDVGIVLAVIALLEISVTVGGGEGAAKLDLRAYLLGAVIALPLLFRHRWPLRVLQICFVAIILYYSLDRRNISPAPLLGIPVYDVALAGDLAWAIAIPAIVMSAGLLFVGLSGSESAVALASNFYPSIVLFVMAVLLGEVVRGRRALAAETAERLRLQVAEERLRIARELHDTVAHSMATIAVQAGSALHLISQNDIGSASPLNDSLRAIRQTSKSALSDMRLVLGQLRGDAPVDGRAVPTGLDRLAALRDAVSAAGTSVTVDVEGDPVPLPPAADHAAYRILQESLTNVLRHAGPGAAATVRVCYQPGSLALSVTDNGDGVSDEGSGHGITGMRERAAAVGGTLTAGRRADGCFEVSALLPIEEPA